MIRCEICNTEYGDQYRFKRHLDMHQRKNEQVELVGEIKQQIELNTNKQHQCDKCNKNFRSPYYVKIHQKKSCKNNNLTEDLYVT